MMLSDSGVFISEVERYVNHPKLTSVWTHENDSKRSGLYSLQVGTISGLLGSLMFESTGKTFSISALIEVP